MNEIEKIAANLEKAEKTGSGGYICFCDEDRIKERPCVNCPCIRQIKFLNIQGDSNHERDRGHY